MRVQKFDNPKRFALLHPYSITTDKGKYIVLQCFNESDCRLRFDCEYNKNKVGYLVEVKKL